MNSAMLQQLVQMGFNEQDAQNALIATKAQSLDQAIDYLYNTQSSTAQPTNDVTPTTYYTDDTSSSSSEPLQLTATVLRNSALQLKTDKLKGDSAEVKMQFEEKRKREESEKLRQEKLADKRRLKELKKQIQAEKEARQREQVERLQRFEVNLTSNNQVQTSRYESEVVKSEERTASPSSSSGTSSSVRECTIQIRLPSGKTLLCKITSDKSLQEVYDFVVANEEEFSSGAEEFSFITPFPRKEYNPQEIQLSMVPLSEAGLVPRGSLIVQKLKSKGLVTRGVADPTPTNTTMDDDDN